MAKRKLRILLDLSRAARGYCGVAQDVRLLYKTLASCRDLEVTGLVYLPRRLRPMHRFLRPSARRSERLANQACFLWELGNQQVEWPPSRRLRWMKRYWQLASTVLGWRVQLDRLESDVFWDAIWRLLFSQTLAAEDLPLVHDGEFLLSNLSDGVFQSRVLLGRRAIKLDTRDYDYCVVQDVRPLRLSRGTRLIVRYHDLIPVLRPDTMANPYYIRWHHRAIRQHAADTTFVCNSEPTRDDLTSAYPELCNRSLTIPYALSDAYRPATTPSSIAGIVTRRRSSSAGPLPALADQPMKYILCVSTLEPRKNYPALIQAFSMLKQRAGETSPIRDLKLMIVGNPGWKCDAILQGMRDLAERGEVVHLENVPAEELRDLYSQASALVFPSNYEGFGFPPLEAMQCGTPVIASNIAAHRWVLGDAALYCNPYDVESIAASIERLLASDESDALREQLVDKGRQRVKLYDEKRCAEKWLDLFGCASSQVADVDDVRSRILNEAA